MTDQIDPDDEQVLIMPTISSGVEVAGATPFSVVETRLRERKQVFVRNKRPQSWLVLVMKDASGKEMGKGWHVPATSIPFDITTYVSPDALLVNESFRTFFAKGLLEYVPPAQAAKDLRDPEKFASLKRTLNDANGTNAARADEAAAYVKSQQLQQTMDQMLPGMNLAGANRVPDFQQSNAPPATSLTVSAKLAKIDAMAKSKSRGPEAIQSELSAILGELSPQQLLQVSTSAYYPESVRAWATERAKYV